MESYLDEVSDRKLLTYLQYALDNRHDREFKPIQKCCRGILPTHNGHKSSNLDTVAVISNQEHSKILGTMTCHSVWSCPYCAPKVMSKYGTKIACAIDALAKQGQFAAMITFTIPHLHFMTAEETFRILQNTWRNFSRGKTCTTKKYVTKQTDSKHNPRNSKHAAGTVREYKLKGTCVSYATMITELEIQHYIRVYEFTWGENSWHPHIHSLFWVPAKNFDKIADYEDRLFEQWWRAVKLEATKFYTKRFNDPEKAKQIVDKVYAEGKKKHKSVYISKDAHGKPIKQQSSMYVTGWTANVEMTQQHFKTTRGDGHYTPRQILEMAREANQKHDTDTEQKWLNLYIDYIKATYNKFRMRMSRTGLNKIIRDWMLSEDYFESLKKKLSDKEKPQQPWKVIVWFYRDEWSDICTFDALNHNDGIISQILKLARAPDIDAARLEIKQFLENYGLTVHTTGDVFVDIDKAANFKSYAMRVA